MVRRQQMADRALRPAMRSPGRPIPARHVEREFWRLVGRLVPGDVDHVAIYLGPDGRCAEAGARGVITFDVLNGVWDTERMARQRGLLFDTFYGVVSPLDVLGYSDEDEVNMRTAIATYILMQVGKPYNLNFFNPETEDAFYCSQLIYKAYQTIGIDMNTGLAMEQLPGTNQIIYQQEIWEGFSHRKPSLNPNAALA